MAHTLALEFRQMIDEEESLLLTPVERYSLDEDAIANRFSTFTKTPRLYPCSC